MRLREYSDNAELKTPAWMSSVEMPSRRAVFHERRPTPQMRLQPDLAGQAVDEVLDVDHRVG